MIVTPAIPQSQEYHNFADQRQFFDSYTYKLRITTLMVLIIVAFAAGEVMWSVIVIEFYACDKVCKVNCGLDLFFHWCGCCWGWFLVLSSRPDDARLVWDRLPMTIAFTSIMAIFIIERIDELKGTVSIIPLLLAGVISILLFDDLRPYAVVQFVPCIVIPLMAILLPPMYTFYILALGSSILSFSKDRRSHG
ncbi:importin-4-like isoform X1 [Hibiscus syriacus]|uniref:Importin-4-like isoform X1 n=1 Tax=Hibiscus syriacus TaxID=106335 RepID=A0A6A3BVE6_HIBSY|nr:importin-4-like isoform X1 [Hibiscus syriacus]